jgi:hypothetical protein
MLQATTALVQASMGWMKNNMKNQENLESKVRLMKERYST